MVSGTLPRSHSSSLLGRQLFPLAGDVLVEPLLCRSISMCSLALGVGWTRGGSGRRPVAFTALGTSVPDPTTTPKNRKGQTDDGISGGGRFDFREGQGQGQGRDRGKRRSTLARSVLYRLRMPGPVGRIDEIVIDCRDRVKLATFWAALLRVTPHVRDSTRATVPDPEQGLVVAFQEVPEPKSGKNRLHIDVRVVALEEAIAASVTLGATVEGAIIDDADGSFQVMLDPEGHKFCLVTSSLAREPSQGQRV